MALEYAFLIESISTEENKSIEQLLSKSSLNYFSNSILFVDGFLDEKGFLARAYRKDDYFEGMTNNFHYSYTIDFILNKDFDFKVAISNVISFIIEIILIIRSDALFTFNGEIVLLEYRSGKIILNTSDLWEQLDYRKLFSEIDYIL